MDCFADRKDPCCVLIANQLSEFFTQTNEITTTTLNSILNANFDECDDPIAERNARLSQANAAADAINTELLQALQEVNCNPNADPACCESSAQALTSIAVSYLLRLNAVVTNGVVPPPDPSSCFFTDPDTARLARLTIEDILSDYNAAVKGLLDIVLCRRKPCPPYPPKPCPPKPCKPCGENPWYVQYEVNVPKADTKCKSSSSSSSEDKKHKKPEKEGKKEKKNCHCRKCRAKKEKSHGW